MAISLPDFNNLTTKDKKKTLEDLKKEIGVSGLVNEWNVSRSKVYSLLHEFDIPVGAKKRKLKPQKPLAMADASKSKSSPEKQKNSEQSNFDMETKTDAAKFSLYLETQGTPSLINETVQHLLGSQNFGSSTLKMNLTLQEI